MARYGDIVAPPTIHALLQARIDSLDGDVRVVMEGGSVEGEVFHRGAVVDFSPVAVRNGVELHLADLVLKGVLHPVDVPGVPGGRGVPVPTSPSPRCGLRIAPEGDEGRAARYFADWLVTKARGA